MTLFKLKFPQDTKMEQGNRELNTLFIESERISKSNDSSRRPSNESTCSLNVPLSVRFEREATPQVNSTVINNLGDKNRSQSLHNITRYSKSSSVQPDQDEFLNGIEESPRDFGRTYRRGSVPFEKPQLNNFSAIKDAFGPQCNDDSQMTLPGTPLPSLVQDTPEESTVKSAPITPAEKEEENLVKEGLELELEHKDLSFDDSDDNIPTKEICDPAGPGNITLCPLCDKACKYQKLIDSCKFARLTYLFDNPATVFFAIFMSLWATVFLELWRRKQSVIQWEWDLHGTEQDEEPRPEFETSVKTYRTNPVTRDKEPYLPTGSKVLRLAVTGSAVFFMFYHKLAINLTNLESPRTQTEYEDSYTFKIFLFEFMNFYSSLIYIAFFKGRFFDYPGDTISRKSEFFRVKGDVCDPAGCLSELCIQLSIIMIGKQIFNNFVELFNPAFYNWWRWRTHRSNTKDLNRKHTRWEEDYHLQDPGRLALFDEYLEMILQYGFVTLFVAAFPLAPLCALLNNIAEIRLDAYKMVTQARRPLAERVEDIGAWYGILRAITYAAVLKTQMQREALLAKEAKYEHGLKKNDYDYDELLSTFKDNNIRSDGRVGK
ncbi:hypothetical protein NQ314_014548 [Rhamnusium bicolor]|uniref:Anoctamin n=1 Tax=Rhamnusium bicolor TaxID=1586634 RepID=A0AAV8X0V6_9CUCU|nr:hypothetical protein NQ314_014548 [Rhamnusium bicolor]